MPLNAIVADKLWDEFLQRWPLDALKSISIEQYTGAEDKDTFSYWLETKTEDLGSIWGGSAFKFGIYRRLDDEVKPSGRGRMFGAEYGWYEKYGKTPEEAFSSSLAEVVKIATAARNGDLTAVEEADLGDAVKWKIAFLYQNRDHLKILPIYKLEILRALTGNKDKNVGFPELNAQLLKSRGDKPLFVYAGELWEKGKATLEKKLVHEDALAYLQNRFKPIKEAVKYMAGFETESGRQIGLVGRGQDVTVFVEAGEWPSLVPGVAFQNRYDKDDPRPHSLQPNVPNLTVGHAADQLNIPTMEVLVALCDAYEGASAPPPKKSVSASMIVSQKVANYGSHQAMNRILYGPPGTGKTFKTAALAVAACDGSAEKERDKLMYRYAQLCNEGRIGFVTFHQSYGYEDFVEGLRPEIKGGQVSYRVRPGVFRDICDAARRSTLVKPGLTGKAITERAIYKMSLGIAGTSEGKLAFQECIEKGYVLLGWGENIDFSECKNADDVRKKIDAEGLVDRPDSQARNVSLFKDQVEVGDIIIVSQGNLAFRAIGEVIGPYEYLEAAAAGSYHQMRPVRWLAIFESNRDVEEIFDRKFVQLALYQLDHDGLKFDVLEKLVNGAQEKSRQSFVLIIDEINRANISKVFGELITLLEPDKREGEINAIKVQLPYSGEKFSVPSNLHIIGTMNTADRSIALLDTALRRRFDFEELLPEVLFLPEEKVEGVDLRSMLLAINERIEYLYDRDHAIGHAYLMGITNLADLDRVFRHKIIPLLQEYFFENWSKVREALNDNDQEFIEVRNSVPFGVESISDGADAKPRYRLRSGPFPLSAYLNIYQ